MKALLIISVFCLAVTFNVSGQATPQEMLNKAIYEEEVNGNLDEAIKLFLEIVDKNSTNRTVTVEAFYHLGLTNEKLGNKKAKEYYEKIVNSFGDQPEFVRIARERLSRLTTIESPKEIAIRQVWTGPDVDNSGSVSADGVYLSFTNWETGNLTIRNLKTGENRQLTNDATWNKPQQYAEYSLISPDGKQVAYLWFNDRGDKGIYELRSIKVGNQTPTVLYYCSKDEYLTPELWLSDGKKIIFQKSDRKNKIWQLFSIDVANKEVQLLKEEILPFWINNLSLSPDDKYIAFELSNPSDKRMYDIHLMSIDSKTELPLVEHPANDRLIGWLPDRNELLFISDRSGTWDLWAITVNDGKPAGLVKRIYTDIGEVQSMGLTQNGECFLGFFKRTFYTHIVPFNSKTGELKEESGKSLTGSNLWVKWSPDGQYLTYTKEDSKADNLWQLIIQDLKTSEERKVANNLIRASSPCWSPDGNSILVVGTDKTESRTQGYKKGGIYKTDVRTGQTTEILNLSDLKYNAPEDESFPISDVEWSSDGKSIFYLLFTDRLVKRDLKTGEEKILYKHSRFVRGVLNRSPDGKSLLFGVFSPEEKKSRLLTIPVEGRTEKEVCTSQEAISFNTAIWSPDGKYIYFAERKDGTNLWRVAAEGGIPQKVGHLKNTIEGFSIHPDGTQLAFGTLEESTEIRVIENLVQELEKLDKMPK